jgi:hypothetical protein
VRVAHAYSCKGVEPLSLAIASTARVRARSHGGDNSSIMIACGWVACDLEQRRWKQADASFQANRCQQARRSFRSLKLTPTSFAKVVSGRSNLITDCIILEGNPRDSDLAVRMMEKHQKQFGRAAEQAAFDGGFATKDNLTTLKGMGIKDVFSKRVGLAISDMVKNSWVYKRLRDFRAGIEGVISFLT